MKRLFRLGRGPAGAARDVNSELRFHIDMRTQEFIAQGMSPPDARRAAEAAFGDVAAVESEVRSARVTHVAHMARRDWWGSLVMDARYASRALRKNPMFSATATLTLTLGIGATVAVFTVVNGVLMRPLPYANPSTLGMIWLSGSKQQGLGPQLPLASGLFAQLEATSSSFDHVAAFRSWPYTAAGDGPAEQIAGARVSPSLFAVLGVHPYAGSLFSDSVAHGGDSHVALLSYAYWQRRFGGTQSAIGQRIVLSGESFTIAGVMPQNFSFPRGAELPPGLQFPSRTDVWTPLVFSAADKTNYGTLNLAAIGRLKPGVTNDAAATEMNGALHRLLASVNARLAFDYRVVDLKSQAGGPVRRSLLMLMGAVAFVLLITCANVANLLIGRTASRQREFSVRAALGAGHGRIARQLVTENVVLTAAGAGLGLLLSMWSVRAMLSRMPAALPRADDVAVDWRVIALTFSVALVAGGVFGLATALHARRFNLAASLQAGAARATGGVTRRMGRRFLVVAEISLSLVLMIGAAQLTASFIRLQHVAPGFDSHHALVAGVLLPLPDGFNPGRDAPKWRDFFTGLTTRLNESPGISAAGGISSLPLTGADESGNTSIVGRAAPPDGSGLRAGYAIVSGAYFSAMKIRILGGRAFDARDVSTSAPVCVVNREYARRYFGAAGSAGVVGQQITTTFEFFGSPQRTIVGVVDDVHQSTLDAPPSPEVFLSQQQMPYPFLTIVVRTTSADPATAAATLRREVRALDADAAVANLRPLDDVVAESIARQRFSMMIVGVFASVSLMLAMVGLYGVVALSVRLRQREIGVRMALGARGANLVGLMLREGVWVTLTGVAVGLAGAAAVSRALATMLYDANAADIELFALSAGGVALVSLVATYVPARRAVRVHPTEALRAE